MLKLFEIIVSTLQASRGEGMFVWEAAFKQQELYLLFYSIIHADACTQLLQQAEQLLRE